MRFLDCIFKFKSPTSFYYFPDIGITDCKIRQYNDFLVKQAQTVFKILQRHKVTFYLFAGAAIGLLRNGQSVPWADDFDLLIFEDQVEKFMMNSPLIRELYLNNFYIKWIIPGEKVVILSKTVSSFKGNESWLFIDFFIAKNNTEKVECYTGLIAKKDIPMKWVVPEKYYQFDGMILPFFNQVESDIAKEYGDISTIVIHVDHQSRFVIDHPWQEVYKEYDDLKEKAIENTKRLFWHNKLYKPLDEWRVDSAPKDIFLVLKLINKKNIGKIRIFDPRFLVYLPSIKFYFPSCSCHFYTNRFLLAFAGYYNYLDTIFVKNDQLSKKYSQLTFINQPNIIVDPAAKYQHLNTNYKMNNLFKIEKAFAQEAGAIAMHVIKNGFKMYD